MGCFKDLSYNTTIILKPKQQLESGGDSYTLPGVAAYAFVADTTDFTVTSYEEALSGIMSNKETGEQITAFAAATASSEQNSLELIVDRDVEVISIVVIDTVNGDYGYTTYELGINLTTTYIAVNFAPWKEGKFEYGDWCFYVEEPYVAPSIPEVEIYEDEDEDEDEDEEEQQQDDEEEPQDEEQEQEVVE